MIEFFPPQQVAVAIVLGLLFPVVLLGTRYLPVISGNPSLRFLVACLAALVFWAGVLFISGRRHLTPTLDDLSGLLVLLSSFVVGLGLWGLLTRGCSLSILMSLHGLGGASTDTELGANYSGGRGLEWLGEKRINSLVKAGLAERRGESIHVTSPLGRLGAHTCTILTRAIGLRSFG